MKRTSGMNNIQEKTHPMDSPDPLEALKVFDRLEVGPIRLESKRFTAPYRLFRDGREESTRLIYSYEEPVFDPSEPESWNLACMIAVQAALNYGLFCRSMVFHGVFDLTDRRFLIDMMENTAREIFVNKCVLPNPFLIGKAAGLPVIKKKRYTGGTLTFSDAGPFTAKPAWRFCHTRRDRLCVLSSGGKDSLLTFGLLHEIGRDVHPIFVNESGRHWFTAINAYRHFKKTFPSTARVWTNSDRLFNWMLRRMPFIRQDYTRMRSDAYPVRLWTVAVFIFGVLPLMRKREIGRLVIGDEYDSTVRRNEKGIPHYNGLYDQSIFFDNALSRFFFRKGWSISQFSILRPLSELLIEKMLYERYPELQQHQMSCHAAHAGPQSMLPCGRCEKCRRIISMLTAIGADPRRCGYTDDHIDRFLRRPVLEDLHQEKAAIEHLSAMLAQKNIPIDSDRIKIRFSEHPELMKLRFHPVNSPVTAIPVDLRLSLYTLILDHAAGAVRRVGSRWIACNPYADPEFNQAYVFEVDGTKPAASREKASALPHSNGWLWEELTWPEVRDHIQKTDVALLPVGAIEQHGPHLPVDTDAFDARYLARRVAAACSEPRPLVLPLVPYGVSYHHDAFPGTLSISNETLYRVVYEIGMAAARNGIKKLIIINGHGGNAPALNQAAQTINRDARIFVCVDSGETSDTDIDELITTPNDVHAGEMETSTSLAVRPHLVKMAYARASIPRFSSRYLNFSSKRSVSWYGFTHKISDVGIMGNPWNASAEKGSKIWEIMIAHLVSLVEDVRPMTLDEIHHRKP
ncbi:MAG: creatininase family protein [Desulfobacterales bacterium]